MDGEALYGARIATAPVFLLAAIGRGTGVILEQRQVRVSRVLASAYGAAQVSCESPSRASVSAAALSRAAT
ncbi:hypothetical protein ACFY2R_13200 [Micromonospora olivasterospora]|uniref:hypothetical protein n=1 Tax=Micromonospora olivasterospora TaxID=1880 RepID=UPI00119D9D19|nr:hypothetical protein [Micromonospora olivasterospora]